MLPLLSADMHFIVLACRRLTFDCHVSLAVKHFLWLAHPVLRASFQLSSINCSLPIWSNPKHQSLLSLDSMLHFVTDSRPFCMCVCVFNWATICGAHMHFLFLLHDLIVFFHKLDLLPQCSTTGFCLIISRSWAQKKMCNVWHLDEDKKHEWHELIKSFYWCLIVSISLFLFLFCLHLLAIFGAIVRRPVVRYTSF